MYIIILLYIFYLFHENIRYLLLILRIWHLENRLKNIQPKYLSQFDIIEYLNKKRIIIYNKCKFIQYIMNIIY